MKDAQNRYLDVGIPGLPYNENLLVRIKLQLNPDGTIWSEILDHARMNKPGQVLKFW